MRPRFLANVVSFSRVLPDYDLASIFTDALSTPPTPKFGIYSSNKRAITSVVSVTSGEFGNFTVEYDDKMAIAKLRPEIVRIGGIDKEGFLLFGPDGRQVTCTQFFLDAFFYLYKRVCLPSVRPWPVGHKRVKIMLKCHF